ncbi:hypothetical protein [Paracoccus fistulariae]|uniref:Uncharacterized protein n=1 Tax=Paracoccus fistulariae TaxID=658446 RepID=A0ABY7SIP3_9RHOB|nr:hypothetical protein [Paracoccus fistulariae]MDB6182934.1 hypothetical protein [Paracoccus fistulariae]WCR06869.1 hypothetical protein JHX87_15560 [Paracoccus fistulariae]
MWDVICRLLCAISVIFGLASGADAGAWMRDPKAGFLSFSSEIDLDGNSYTGIYSEYGLNARNTLGFELGYTNVGETSMMIWLQRRLGSGEGPNQWTYSTGFGAFLREGQLFPTGQIGINWGRGFEHVLGGGWMSVEARLKIAGKQEQVVYLQGKTLTEAEFLTPEITTKIDATLGLRPTDSLMFINQLRLEDRSDVDFSARLASSLVYDFGAPAKLELGLIAPISGAGEVAVKIGTWIEF